MFQILVTKPATQAVFLVTIFLLKLKQSLRIGSGRYRQTGTIPKSGYVIVFGLQGFKETGGTVTQNVIGLVQAISIKKRDDRIDGNQIQGTVPYPLFPPQSENAPKASTSCSQSSESASATSAPYSHPALHVPLRPIPFPTGHSDF